MNWYYVDAGQQAGPVDDAQLEELLRSGKIQSDTLVWREGMANWQPYNQAKSLGQTFAASPAVATTTGGAQEAVCVECGKIFNTDDMIRHGGNYVCATCKPVFMQKLAEGAKVADGSLNYAGFWIRFAAKFVDGLIISAVIIIPFLILLFSVGMGMRAANGPQPGFELTPESGVALAAASGAPDVIASVAGLFAQLVFLALHTLYATVFLGKYGATPGKMLCKIMVVDGQGNRIGYGRAFGRSCAEILSRIICAIGYIIAAFDSQKRTLHDHMCNTRVVYK